MEIIIVLVLLVVVAIAGVIWAHKHSSTVNNIAEQVDSIATKIDALKK